MSSNVGTILVGALTACPQLISLLAGSAAFLASKDGLQNQAKFPKLPAPSPQGRADTLCYSLSYDPLVTISVPFFGLEAISAHLEAPIKITQQDLNDSQQSLPLPNPEMSLREVVLQNR